MGLAGWLVAYTARWLPHSADTGLKAIGKPTEDSPVIVTSNFSLTVNRVTRALKGMDLWLLVANTQGINVWCAACGGMFTENHVIDAIKVAGLSERVSHNQVILPALSAPGIDCNAIKDETGFRARFGPVQAADIPAYLAHKKKKTSEMKRFKFDLSHRLDMLFPMNFPIYLPFAVVLAVFWPGLLLGATLIFWGALLFLYLFVPWIPGKTGWTQAIVSAGLFVAMWAGFDLYFTGDPLLHYKWFMASFAIFLAAGFDLAGIATGRKSDAEQLVQKLGIKSMGSLFKEKDLGEITLDREKCDGCRTCFNICPVGVYNGLDQERKMTFQDRGACFACSACVKQCPQEALSLAGI